MNSNPIQKNLLLPVSLLAVLISAALAAPSARAAETDYSAVEIKPLKVAGGIYLISGPGGNIAVSTGKDATFIIDDLFAPLTEKITAAIATLTDKPVQFVINTHWHGDHTGGNENFGKAGSVIIAQENVRKRMTAGQFMEFFKREVPPAPPAALPVITFTKNLSLHLNGEDTRIFSVQHAHTDGDCVVHFTGSNVIHTGDTYFNGLYPFIDLSSGGSIDGVIAATGLVLSLIDDNTKVIPGHGPLSDKRGLQEYRDMLTTVRDRIAALIADGKTLEETVAAAPTQEYDKTLGNGFVSPAQFTEIIYTSLKKQP